MRIHRFSPAFCLLLALFLCLLLALFAISARNRISPDDYEALGLPILFIDTEAGKKIKSKEKYLDMQYRLDGQDGSLTGSGKIRGRGNSTWDTFDTSKRPYLIKLDAETSFMGMATAQKWVLLANATDKTFLRNEYARHLGRQVWNRFAWVPQERFITLCVNGRYEGLYCLSEKVELLPGRLQAGGEESFLAVVNIHRNKEWNFDTSRGVHISLRGDADMDTYRKEQALLQDIEDTLFSPDFADPATGYRSRIDLPSFVDWYLVNEFTRNYDARFQASCYLYYDSDAERLFMGPLWDFDTSCGNERDHESYKTAGYIVNTRHWYKRLFEDPFFAQAVRDRWQERAEETYASIAWVREQAETLRAAAELNDKAWKSFGHRQWPNAPGWQKRKTYQSEVDYLTDWLSGRFIWMNGEFGTE